MSSDPVHRLAPRLDTEYDNLIKSIIDHKDERYCIIWLDWDYRAACIALKEVLRRLEESPWVSLMIVHYRSSTIKLGKCEVIFGDMREPYMFSGIDCQALDGPAWRAAEYMRSRLRNNSISIKVDAKETIDGLEGMSEIIKEVVAKDIQSYGGRKQFISR